MTTTKTTALPEITYSWLDASKVRAARVAKRWTYDDLADAMTVVRALSDSADGYAFTAERVARYEVEIEGGWLHAGNGPRPERDPRVWPIGPVEIMGREISSWELHEALGVEQNSLFTCVRYAPEKPKWAAD